MFEKICFCVGEKNIELNGSVFSLGEFTAQVLNIPTDEHRKMYLLAQDAFQTIEKNKTPPLKEEWFECNEKLIELEKMMLRYRVLALIKDEKQILYEAQTYLSQLSILDDNDKYEMCKSEEDLRKMMLMYDSYLDEWEDSPLQRVIPENADIRELPHELLIFPGDVKDKWDYYCRYCYNYFNVLFDIAWFNNTVLNFMEHYLSALKKLNRENYAAALYEFLNDESAETLIANPSRGSGLYASADKMILRHVPRETFHGSGVYKIYTYYEVERFQALLKTDFYRALEAGYIIRKCEYCGRCFLLKKGYHTKYCDKPAPDNPKYTCEQMGYRYRGTKEAVSDNPKAQSLHRCLGRIQKDYERNVITSEEKELLGKTAHDMYHSATTRSGITNEDFEDSLSSKNLYPKCGVERKSNRRGRPKG